MRVDQHLLQLGTSISSVALESVIISIIERESVGGGVQGGFGGLFPPGMCGIRSGLQIT